MRAIVWPTSTIQKHNDNHAEVRLKNEDVRQTDFLPMHQDHRDTSIGGVALFFPVLLVYFYYSAVEKNKVRHRFSSLRARLALTMHYTLTTRDTQNMKYTRLTCMAKKIGLANVLVVLQKWGPFTSMSFRLHGDLFSALFTYNSTAQLLSHQICVRFSYLMHYLVAFDRSHIPPKCAAMHLRVRKS